MGRYFADVLQCLGKCHCERAIGHPLENCSFRQYIPVKPGKYGLKFWTCCDRQTAYVYNIQLYLGKREGNLNGQNNQKTIVVMSMVKI